MYLHLGADCVIKKSSIIGIFDIENTSVSKVTKDYLNSVSKNGKVIYITNELPKSFIICKENDKQTVYISQISVSTLKKRFKQKFQECSL